MDSLKLIAFPSILTAGFTTSIANLAPALAEGRPVAIAQVIGSSR